MPLYLLFFLNSFCLPEALAGEERIVGFLRIDSAKAAIVPPWLVGDLVDLIGPGVARAAADRAEAEDRREGIGGYLEAFRAEAAYAEGDAVAFEAHADRALESLSRGERMLRARLLGERAVLLCSKRLDARCASDLAAVTDLDPGLFRRLQVAIPVRLEVSPGGEALAEMLARSPRFDVGEGGLVLRVTGPSSACVGTSDGQIFECAEEDDPASAARALQERVFSPRVELSRIDLDSLDGGSGAARDPLAPLLDTDL